MKIGVISDTHGSLTAWQQALAGPLADVDLIIHTGDVLYHGARNPLPEGYNPAELAEAINACRIPILIVKGNCDSEVDQMVLTTPLQSPFLITDQPLGRILATHGHYFDNQQSADLAERYQIEIWISGHTHVPLLEKREQTVFLNPGSCSLPKGEELHRSAAVIAEKQVQLIDLDTNLVFKQLDR